MWQTLSHVISLLNGEGAQGLMGQIRQVKVSLGERSTWQKREANEGGGRNFI